MATKPKGGGAELKALVAGPLKKDFFAAFISHFIALCGGIRLLTRRLQKNYSARIVRQ